MYCTECKKYVSSGEDTYIEDLSFDYAGTHCTFGRRGTHHQLGDEKSICCDADVVDYLEDEDDR